MTYYISLFLFSFKTLLFYADYFVVSQNLWKLFIMLNVPIISIFFLKMVNSLTLKDSIEFRVIKYCLEYPLERFYSLFIVILFLSSIFGTLIFYRFHNIMKIINLIELKNRLFHFFSISSFFNVIAHIIVLFIFIYLIILMLKTLWTYINKEIVKLHIYYLKHEWYAKCHNYFNFHLSVEVVFISKIQTLYFKVMNYIITHRNERFLSDYTKEEKKAIYTGLEKVEKYFKFGWISIFFYKLHYIGLVLVLSYDILYNDYTLLYVFKYLPFMLLYQIYIGLSRFVLEKTLTDTCAIAHMIFYQKPVYITDKVIMLNGEFYDAPNTFLDDFLRYEASNFTRDRQSKE